MRVPMSDATPKYCHSMNKLSKICSGPDHTIFK